MSRWDGLKSDGGRSHAQEREANHHHHHHQQRRYRPRPGGSGGSGGNTNASGWGSSSSISNRSHRAAGSSTSNDHRRTHQRWQPRRQQQQRTSDLPPLRRGGTIDDEARQAFDDNLRLLEQKLTEFQEQDAEPSRVKDTAPIKKVLVALQAQQRQGWLREDAKRLGWTIESLFRSVQCIATYMVTTPASSCISFDTNGASDDKGVEPLVYDMTAETLQMMSDESSAGYSFRASATKMCAEALVFRIHSVALDDATTATTPVASAVPIANSMLQCLDTVFLKFGSALPAEETAERAVRYLLVPIVESARSSDASVNGDGDESRRHVMCRSILPAALSCISSLVSHKQQASAILAPLVLDITNDGDERQVTNPLRLRLISLLQGMLLRENDNSIVATICGCFSSILDAVYLLDRESRARGKGSTTGGTELLNMASTARRIRTLLEPHGNIISGNCNDGGGESDRLDLPIYVLRLLSSLARTFPRAMAGQWAFFLEETMVAYDPLSSPLKIAGSMSTASSSLLVTFIENGSVREKIAAMEASKALISTMPLKLWFGLSTQRDGRRTFTGTTSLPIRVAKAIGQLLNALKATLQTERDESEIDSIVIGTCSIVEVMIQTEPFFCDESLALVLTDLLNAMRMLLAKESGKSVSEIAATVAIMRTFVKGTGGTINSAGDLIPLSKPMEKWLGNVDNQKFLLQLFSMLVRNDGTDGDGAFIGNNEKFRQQAGSLLMLVLRMAPSILNKGKESGWTSENFTSSVLNLLRDDNPKRRQLGLQLVQHYIEGRNDFSSDDRSSFVSDAFGSVLLRALADTNSSVRSLSAETYGLFLRSDWAILLERSKDHYSHLLKRCVGKGESVAGVRSKACKAIGNMCSECCGDSTGSEFNPSQGETFVRIDGLESIVGNVLDTMTIALEDENPTVRGMALYCIGNLSLSLQSSALVESTGVASNSSLPTLCVLVRKCLEDKNDKVVGNAIRTQGHLLNLLQTSRCNDERTFFMSNALYRDTIIILTQKLNSALDIAEDKALNMSWKQRSFAKKHAWGACHTLGILLHSATLGDESNRNLFLLPISRMIHCIQISDRLNEKVTAAAVAALKQIPMDVWTEFSGTSTIISDGLVTCLVVVYEESKGIRATKLSPPVRHDIQDLLDLFLSISSADDAIFSFSNEMISPGILDFLYSWMVDKGSKSSSFDSFATALTSNDRVGEFEVSIEQRFSSRARHERRREKITPLTNVDLRGEEESFVSIKSHSRDENDDSDEEDEL